MHVRTETPAAWFRALRLAERASGARTAPPVRAGGATRHDRAWASQPPFDRGDALAQRLARDGLTPSSFRDTLALSADELRARHAEPEWLRELLERYRDDAPPPRQPLPLPASLRGEPTAAFLEVLRPILDRAWLRLSTELERLADGTATPRLTTETIADSLLGSLAGSLLWMIGRTMVLELNAARLMGSLQGDGAEQRFGEFATTLSDAGVARDLLERYPVLARQVMERTEAWLETSIELLGRLERDWPAIRASLFGGADPGTVVGLVSGAGDAHRGGRSVCVLELSSGERLVYKPRPLAVEHQFQRLLDWINARGVAFGASFGALGAYRTLGVLDRGTHGWMEFVAAAPCVTEDDVRRYHRRLGGLIAILHVVGGVDVHFENLVASADQPVLVDLETLFHPTPPLAADALASERVPDALEHSVLRTGLLPFRMEGEDDEEEPPDVSGMASVGGQKAPDSVVTWAHSGRDDMHAVRERPVLAEGRNRPMLDGQTVQATDFVPEVVDGFATVYRLLASHRDELLSPDGPLAAFTGVPVRAVLRPTRAYGVLLDESWHPDLLADALDRDRFFDWLWADTERAGMASAIPFEQQSLWRSEVPCFVTVPERRDLLNWDGRLVQPGFFATSAMDDARRRVLGLDEVDLERQSWLIGVSLGTAVLNRNQGEWMSYALERPAEHRAPAEIQQRAIAAARELGGWFERMAVRDGDAASWVTLDFRNRLWSLSGASAELYSGATGIVLFLAYLGLVTGDAHVETLARAGLEGIRRRHRSDPPALVGPGLLQGWGGSIYTLAHVAALWDRDDLLREAEAQVERVGAAVAEDRDLDLVGGVAGGIAGLLALDRARPSARAREIARACGEHLMATAEPLGTGVAWRNRVGGDEPQAGFAHGSSGIASALIDLAERLGELRFRDTAARALAFEDELIAARPAMGGPNEQPASTDSHRTGTVTAVERAITMSWCYGLPGLCLARLRMSHGSDDRRELGIEALADRVVERWFGKNHCLCHGDLGNLDVLAQVAAARPQSRAGRERWRWADAVVGSIERDGWRCGTWEGVRVPGLMNGLAGIGYGLLRLARPERVPSILAHEPPRR